MSRVSTYLNFQGNTEEAFAFYKELFGTDYIGTVMRLGDAPMPPGIELGDAERQMIMNIQLPITAGHVIMGTDMVESMGHHARVGNNTTIHLEVDDCAEADRLYDALSVDSTEFAPMQDQFWGAYWGTCLDRFGIRWMISAPTGSTSA